jgi:hypothetical protein
MWVGTPRDKKMLAFPTFMSTILGKCQLKSLKRKLEEETEIVPRK